MRCAAALVLLTATATACGGATDATGPDAAIDAAVDAARPPAGDVRGTFQLTYYWVTAEADFAATPTTTLYAPSCAPLAAVRASFADSLDIEGTGRLTDGRLINVTGACGCDRSPCYAETDADHPWGIGVQ